MLLHHPALKGNAAGLSWGETRKPIRLTDIHPAAGRQEHGSSGLMVEPFSWELLKKRGVEVAFAWRPRMSSRGVGRRKQLARGLRVVDLSGAWRLREATSIGRSMANS